MTMMWGLVGGVVLFTYGVIPTLQEEPAFGRVYAAYGGIFIVLSILWGRVVDDWRPDRFDRRSKHHEPATVRPGDAAAAHSIWQQP